MPPSGLDSERRRYRIEQLEAFERAMYRDFYRAAPAAVVVKLGLEASDQPYGLRLTADGENHPFFNRVMLAAAPTNDQLAGIAGHYRSRGVTRWMLQIPPFLQPFDLAACGEPIVELRGWAKHLRDPVLASDLDPESDEGPQVDPITPQQARPWAEIAVAGFAFPAASIEWLEVLAGRPNWHLYLAKVGSQPAATGALFADSGRVALNFAATLPEFRGRGAQSALIRHRIRDAVDGGAVEVVSETDEPPPGKSNPSTHNLVRHGLPVVYLRPNWGPPPPVRPEPPPG